MKRTGFTCLLLLAAAAASAQEIPGQSNGDYREGDFVWFDLVTDDPDAAKRFYARMFGWSYSREKDGYSIARSAGDYVGGIFRDDELDPAKEDARWIPSISVPDVDMAAVSVERAGGEVLIPAGEMPGRGRMAVVEDPAGGVVGLLRMSQGDPAPEEVISGDWLFLQYWTPDLDASAAFYEKALGFSRRGDLLRYGSSNRALLVEIDLEDTEGAWLPMVLVPDIREAVARVKAIGGLVYLEPDAQFGDGRMALVADPTGGAFLLQGAQK